MMAVAVKPGGAEFTFDTAVMLFDQSYFHASGRLQRGARRLASL